jgi:phosphoesterase RecJ-like protein
MQSFIDLIRRKHSFVLSGHEAPDGDCIGAEVALYHLLHSLGKDVRIVNPDAPAPNLDFLARHTPLSVHGGPLPAVDAVVLLDCAWLNRLGALGQRIREEHGGVIAVVDHHVGSEAGDGDVFFVDPDAPSTGALIYRLHRALGVALSSAAAEGVFLSLVADTGWFRFSNTTAEVLEIAARLVGAGVEPSRVYDLMHRRNHPDSVPFIATALARAERSSDGLYVSVLLDRAAMEEAFRIGFDTDLLLEPLRSVRGVEVVALFKERADGAVKVSLRATRNVDVQAISSGFGGGGHRKAAGATVQGPTAQVMRAVKDRIAAAIAALPPDG